MRFLFDEMLRRLASWCRILGIDSEFWGGEGDTRLLARAKKNGLVLVTRDLQLSVRCEKAGVKFIMIRSDAIEEQIAQFLRESGAIVTFPEKTRCASCNGELLDAPPETVKDELPENVLQNNKKFWRCPKCNKIYWEGGHWKNIVRIYEKALEIMKG
ncbi:MAG: Mut7-C RNAse domain-containing protein [Candidatus Micrarchaeota archaeon]